MENNNTPRSARIYYSGESIPVLVVDESERSYELLLDWSKPSEESDTFKERDRKRDLYLDAVFGWEGAHTVHDDVMTSRTPLHLRKNASNVTLVFDEPEPEEEQGEPTEMIDPDSELPLPEAHQLTELDKQLNLMKSLGYKVKSFDVSIQEGGEAHLCASFAKEVDK